MVSLGLFEGILAVLWAVTTAMIYQRLQGRIVELESMLLRELEEGIATVGDSIDSQLQKIGETVQQAADIDPLDQIELFRQTIINNLMSMGVEFIGKKFGAQLGVHSIEETEPPASSDGPRLEDFT